MERLPGREVDESLPGYEMLIIKREHLWYKRINRARGRGTRERMVMATAATELVLERPRWNEVKARADELTAVYSSPPIPVLEIAENHGVDVVFASFGGAGESVAGFCDFENAKLYVNAADQIERQTFTIAHELGHWLLHRPFFEANPEKYNILPRFQQVFENDPFEKEANSFAANLLVPKRLIAPVKGAPVEKLADIFAVSRTMMEFRLKNV